MFEGKKFLPTTGMPMRKIACISRPLALAEPVPLTLASLRTKSLTRSCAAARLTCAVSPSPAWGQWIVDFCMSQAAVGQRSAHRPQCTQRSSSLTMTRPVCGSARGDVERLRRVRRPARAGACAARPPRRRGVMVRQSTGQMSMQASHSMHSLAVEHRLDVAVEAALHFLRGLLGVEAELHLDVELLEALLQRHVRHHPALEPGCSRCCSSTRACPSCG